MFTIGEKFEDQIERVTTPHAYEGNVYECAGGDFVMFCQVGYGAFTFIGLVTGNRAFAPIKYKNTPDKDILLAMHKSADETMMYKGDIMQWIAGME